MSPDAASSRPVNTVFVTAAAVSLGIFLIARPCWGYGSSAQIILEMHLYYRTGGRDYVINLLEHSRARQSWLVIQRYNYTQNGFICGDLNSRYEPGLHDWQLTRFSLLRVISGLGGLWGCEGVVTVCWCLQSGCCGHHLRPDGPRTACSYGQYCNSVTMN